ncbi:MAG: hypothetical protein K6G15_09480 [Desulfovibrio sp.]|nr:hypothetical protein [Desulfovibrio sp.]
MRESSPAQAARKHLEEARNVLQKGLQSLEEEWKDAPEDERRKVLAEGLAALQQRMAVEENLANRQVMALLEEECEKWRATHKAVSVVSRQSLLAADNATDITPEIVAAMNARVLEFPAQPFVQVKKREDSKGSKEDQKSQDGSKR